MANLDNFTNDEQLILALVVAKDALLNKIVELTSKNIDELDDSLAIATGKYTAEISDDEARELINSHRSDHQEAHIEVFKLVNGQEN